MGVPTAAWSMASLLSCLLFASTAAGSLSKTHQVHNVLGAALVMDGDAAVDEPTPRPASAVPRAVNVVKRTKGTPSQASKPTSTSAGAEEDLLGNDVQADLEALAVQHRAVERASAKTEAAMSKEKAKAKELQQAKQDIMLPASELAMIARNSSAGLGLLKQRDVTLTGLESMNEALQREADKIKASNDVIAKKVQAAQAQQASILDEAAAEAKLESKAQSLKEQLGQLLEQQSASSEKAQNQAGDAQESAQQEELLKAENTRLSAQNHNLKIQLAKQLRELKEKRAKLSSDGTRFASLEAKRDAAVRVLKTNQTRLQAEVHALAKEDALWNRRVSKLKPLEGKLAQESARVTKLALVDSKLVKNLRNVKEAIAAGSGQGLRAAAQRLDKEQGLLYADIRHATKRSLHAKTEIRMIRAQSMKLRKQLRMAQSGQLKERDASKRVQRLVLVNEKLQAQVNAVNKQLRTVTTENARLGSYMRELVSDASSDLLGGEAQHSSEDDADQY